MAASKRMGFAVVGLGRIAERAVLPAFKHSRRAKLVALVSGNERKAARLASKFGASDFYSYDDPRARRRGGEAGSGGEADGHRPGRRAAHD